MAIRKGVIPELADRHGPSMIVLGTHGGGRFERGVIGSIAEKILRSPVSPLLPSGLCLFPVISFPFLHRNYHLRRVTAVALVPRQRSAVQHNVDQRTINQHSTTVVIDIAEIAEPVEEEADTGSGGANHFRQRLLAEMIGTTRS